MLQSLEAVLVDLLPAKVPEVGTEEAEDCSLKGTEKVEHLTESDVGRGYDGLLEVLAQDTVQGLEVSYQRRGEGLNSRGVRSHSC